LLYREPKVSFADLPIGVTFNILTTKQFSQNLRISWRAEASTHASTRSNQQNMQVNAASGTASDLQKDGSHNLSRNGVMLYTLK